MPSPHVRLFLLAATLILLGSASLLHAQADFKGAPPPHPEVHRRTRVAPTSPARRSTNKQPGVAVPSSTSKQLPGEEINDEVEGALERGNKLSDEGFFCDNTEDAVPSYCAGRYKLAEKEYRRAVARAPNDARGYYGLGNALAGYSNETEAEQAYKQALKLKPDYAEAYYGLGELFLYSNSKSFEEPNQKGIDYLRKAISLKPDFDRPYLSLGTMYQLQKKYSEALAAYKDAIRHSPNSQLAHRDLGDLYEQLDRHDEAIAEYRQAIRLKPEDDDTYLSLAHVYEILGRYPEAINVYNQIIRLKLDRADYAHHDLGLLYLKLNNRQAAMNEYQAIKAMEPEDSVLADMLLQDINKYDKGKGSPPASTKKP
jgi:tetratricopeptide (TPR) repeat protein